MSKERRYELKFVAPEQLYPHLRHWLHLHDMAFKIAYPLRQINNVYWDTADFDSFQDHILGAIERVKLRYRWYGSGWDSADSRLEIKAKHGLITEKQIYSMQLALAKDARWATVYRQMRGALPQAARLWILRRPQAALLSHYQREYFVCASGIRVTLDRGLRCYDQRYRADVNLLKRSFVPDVMVLEVKCTPEQYPVAQAFLKTMPLRAERYSKYMMGLRSLISY